MAEKVDPIVVEKGVEELEKEITCAICHQHYDEPKVLPCCHYFCKQCIHRLTLRTGTDKPFSCPECRQDTTLPQGGVDQLKTAFFINRMKGVHSKLERAHGKVEAKCEGCSGGKAEAFCRQCTHFICAECVKQHHRMRVFSSHKTVTLNELKEGGAKEISKEEPPVSMCETHKEPMKIYCFTCSCLICRDCTIIDHAEHKYNFIITSAPKKKEMLIQHLTPLKKVEVSLSHAVEEIQTTKSEIEVQGDSVANQIERSFAEYHKIVEKCKQEILKEAAMKVAEKLDHLSIQEKSLSIEHAVVQSVIDYTQQCVEHLTDGEIMCMHDDIQNRIDTEMKEHHSEGQSLEPVEEVDVGVEVSCAEDLHQLFQTKAKIIQLFIVKVKKAEINTKSELSLLANGESMNGKYAVECQLKSLGNGSIIKCNVDLIRENEHRILYTPTIRGRHELIVTANGEEVAGSPFPVFVSIHPTQLGKPVKVNAIDSPRYLAINSAGEIIVTEAGNNGMVVVDKEGKRMRSNSDIKDPYGVAIDDADNIYVADHNSKRVVKLNKDMNILNEIDTEQDSSLFGVSLVGDEVMVCDMKNKCILVVYTKELKYVRQINDPVHFKSIRGVSPDEHGNLYVCDYGNSSIHVLSNGGEYLRSFGCDRSGVNMLCGPHGIYVASQYVYVTNWLNHNISVYTTEGEHVTTFGKKGRNEGDFDRPPGVCVDKDGFVYVCDRWNNRVQVF